jgi:hypothetical protein
VLRSRLREATSRTFLALLLTCAAAAANQGCNCGSNTPQRGCMVDDDCRGLACDPGQYAVCVNNACMCKRDQPIGDIGRFSAMALRGPIAYVCAYNNDYQDLMVGHQTDTSVITEWEFVDGVPSEAPDNPLSHVRGGITDKGDDVGKYCSIAMTSYGDPVISYYDTTHNSLKFASFGAIRWHTHTVDKATGKLPSGDDIGRWTSVTLDKTGAPGIAYYAEVTKGASGGRESQLRFAQSKVPNPESAGDWTITVVTAAPIKAIDPANPPALPEGVALFVNSARKADGSPVVVYYDRPNGNLMYVDFDSGAHKWNAPVILDGQDAMGGDTADVGWYPSVTIDTDGSTAHIAYVDATHDNLLYVNTKTKTPEVADDGYRAKDEVTLDGLPAPVYHLVGDSSSIQLAGNSVLIAYQDATVEQLRLATRDPQSQPMMGKWSTAPIAGHATPFKGSYGFYAQNRVSGSQAVLSSYAINQSVDPPLFYVEIFSVLLTNIVM